MKTDRAGSTTSTTAAAGPRARRTSPRTARSSGRTSRTTGCCATTRRPGNVGVFRAPAGNTNGHTVDPQGRLVSCEHGDRRVTRTEHDGTITVLADAFEGKRLNSPNDVVVRSDGAVYFTDPELRHRGLTTRATRPSSEFTAALLRLPDRSDHGRAEHRRRRLRPPERARVQPRRAAALRRRQRRPHNMSVLDVADDGTLTNKREFAMCTEGGFDGFRLDERRPDLDERRRRRARATTPTARCSARCCVPRSSPTSPGAGRSATGSTSARRLRCTRSCSRSTGRRRCSA